MRSLLFALGVLWLACAVLPSPAAAQDPNAGLDIVAEPVCFAVRNTASYKIFGNFLTDYYTRPDGIRARHRSNFRLDEAGATDPETGAPSDRAEFCSYGPFYPGRKLDLTLRTLVPIFSCRTRLDHGEILIEGRRKEGGGTETRALCFE